MQPILIGFPGWGIKIHAYGVMILLACAGALWITAWRARRERLEVSVFTGWRPGSFWEESSGRGPCS